MKINWSLIAKIFSVLVFLSGLVWFLQGLNILPGSFMTGDPQWIINGGMAMLIGIVLFAAANRFRRA